MKKHPEMREQTKKRILDAFWALAPGKGATKISVTDITKQAQINRGTFYEYFLDMNDLLDFVELEILDDYISRILLLKEDFPSVDMRSTIYKVLEFLTGYDDKLFVLLGANGDPNFTVRIRNEMSKVYPQIVGAESLQQYSGYVIAFISSAIIGLITYWYETGKQITIEELTDILMHFEANGIVGSIIG